jgi:hypothetical protein
MKKNLKFIMLSAILLMLTGGVVSCEDKENCVCLSNADESIFTIAHDSTASIIGKWQLIKGVRVNLKEGLFYTDYSQCNIVYEFSENGVLKISGKTHNTNFNTGIYSHSFIMDNIGNNMVGIKLKIGDKTRFYQLNSAELIIDNRPLDGDAYYFIKNNQNINK